MFIGYFVARLEREFDQLSYMTYVTDSLYMMGHGRVLVQKWGEAIRPCRQPKDERSAEEIAADVIERGGLKLKWI